MSHQVKSFFDTTTETWSHVLWDPATNRCVIIDSVLDYDPVSGRISTESADRVVEFVRQEKLAADWIIDTHAHADHISAAQNIKERLGGVIVIGDGIRSVQKTFRDVFNLGSQFPVDGCQFDKLLLDGDRLPVGDLEMTAMSTPGHTNDSMSLQVDGTIFVGDTLFSPAYGTARCDFPGGDARRLYQSIQTLLAQPDDTRLYLCHDYPAEGASPMAFATVAEQRRNTHLGGGITENDFVLMRESRDATLGLPRLLLPAIQFNIRAGLLPDADDNGVSYLKIPLNQF